MPNVGWMLGHVWHELHYDGEVWWISLSHWGLIYFTPMNEKPA